jgi:hypothetical protein
MRVLYRSILLGVALLSTAACSMFSHTEPAAPTPTGLRWSLSGRIINPASGPIAGAKLTVLDGEDEGAQAGTDAGGQYSFSSLATGRFHLAIEAAGFETVFPVVDLTRDINVDFALQRAGAR